MELTRRKFVKNSAIAAALAAAGLSASSCSSEEVPEPSAEEQEETMQPDTWTKAVCRYCGTGCGVMCGVKDGRLISTVGDPNNESSKGLNCIKGYYLAKAIYGEERLTTPQIREDNSTKGTDDGLRDATWDEALELVSSKLKEAWKNDVSRIAFWGSGQMSIAEGYLASKFWKAGLLSNNIDPNARLCMASAVVGFVSTFQTDEPAGSYKDLDQADVFVTWGANMAEAHPVLYSRLSARKLTGENVKHYDITTMTTRTSVTADKVLTIVPGSDLAIANCIASYLVTNDLYDHDFVAAHGQFKRGSENIGQSIADDYDTTEPGKSAGALESISFEEYGQMIAPYTLEYTSQISGVPEEDLEEICKVFADPDSKVLSLWTMGVNQHYRGTWMNNLIYNIHLLSGKISKPGSGPFSLTGQPSACGTAREVGVFSHRLPADMVVANPQHRNYTEVAWGLPKGYLDPIATPGFHTVKMFHEVSLGNIDFLWTMSTNFAQSMPNLTRILGKDGEHMGIFDCFVVVSDVYPTESCKYANVVLPAAMWVEREGQFGNAERRTTVFEKAIEPAGDAKWDGWALMNVASRVLEGEKIGSDDAFDLLFGQWWDTENQDIAGTDREVNEAIFEEYRTFNNPQLKPELDALNKNEDGAFDGPMKLDAKQLAPYSEYLAHNGMTWPVREVDGQWIQTSWRFADGDQNEGYDQVGVETWGSGESTDGIDFYKSTNHKPSVIFRPYEEPPYTPNEEYPFWFSTGRLLEHWHTGSMTRQVPELLRALPEGLLYMNEDDATDMGVQSGDRVKVTSVYGTFEITCSTDGRVAPPRGMTFAPFFDNKALVNMACMDVYCPLSKEPDYKKTTAKIEKA